MLSIEYSKSNRASCKVCKIKIEKGAIRMGLTSAAFDGGDYDMVSWRHLECFNFSRKYKDLDPDTISGIKDLKPEDQQTVKEFILGGGKKKSLSKAKKSNKDNDDDSKEEEKQNKSESDYEASDEQDDKKKKKKKPVKKAKPEKRKEKIEMIGYTDAQFKQYKDLCQSLSKKTIEQLKNELRINIQPTTGTKPELINKVADGQVLGQIPKCMDCGGGRLRFEYMSGVYKCPGYMNDDEFINCNKKYQFDQVARTTWIKIDQSQSD